MKTANTIFQQLGGQRFVAITGAKDFIGRPDGLSFKLRGGAKQRINCVRITLDPNDTYTVEFMRLSRAPKYDVTTVSTHSDIYCDVLQDLFTRQTGLYTRL